MILFLLSVSLADNSLGFLCPPWDTRARLGRKERCLRRRDAPCKASARRRTVPLALPVSAGRTQPGPHLLSGSAQGSPPPGRRHRDVCATDGRRHKGLNPTKGGEHLMRAGSRSPARLRLRRQQSPALAGLRQGAPAPTAIALGAYLASGGDTVLVLVCELVYLVGQLLHGACPEAASKAPHALEVVHTLAVALDSDAGSVRAAGGGKEGNMRPPSSRAWAPATGTRGILGPEGAGTCYRLLSQGSGGELPLPTPRRRRA